MLCDEPTGNLDPTTSGDIMRLLERINRTGGTVVMATHDERIVDQMRKRVVELKRGMYGSSDNPPRGKPTAPCALTCLEARRRDAAGLGYGMGVC
jgi:ABC-type lipoprotein export system ATPase subunit